MYPSRGGIRRVLIGLALGVLDADLRRLGLASSIMAPLTPTTRPDLRLAWRLARARLEGRPLILSHLITRRCNARCDTCLWRADADETSASGMVELTTEE